MIAPGSARPSLIQLAIECMAIAFSRKLVFLAMVILIGVGACVPLLISLQADRAREQALNSLRTPSLRTIQVSDPSFGSDNAVLTPGTVEQIRRLSDVEDLVAVGGFRDLRPADGWPLSARFPTSDVLLLDPLAEESRCGGVHLSAELAGARVWTLHGATEKLYAPVLGTRQHESAILPASALSIRWVCDWTSARKLTILVRDSQQVYRLAFLLGGRLGTNAQITTPENIEAIRDEVDADLSDSARRLSVLAQVAAGLLSGSIFSMALATQLRHFARRRALGASKGDVFILVLGQVVFATALGVAIAAAALAAVGVGTNLTVSAQRLLAVAIVLLNTGVIATMPMAVLVATRDPATLLRVP